MYQLSSWVRRDGYWGMEKRKYSKDMAVEDAVGRFLSEIGREGEDGKKPFVYDAVWYDDLSAEAIETHYD